MSLRVLNDIHIGAIRAGGTTTATQLALRSNTLETFSSLLPDGSDVMVLGDLFDTNNIPMTDLWSTYVIIDSWLKSNETSKFYNVAGNHDLSKTSNVLSSFQLLGKMLSHNHPDRYIHIESATMTDYGYVIPHVRNQDLFNIELDKVPACDFLFVHCNYDNNFAAQADQSLNLSREQASACKARHIVFAHEHHGREDGKVLIIGSQTATSVSDWLNPRDKRFLQIVSGLPEFVVCNRRNEQFTELDWQELTEVTAKFVRVVGTAAATDANKVVNAINSFRKQSDALVISNAVQIEVEDGAVDFEQTLDAVAGFSVLEALREILTEEEMAVVNTIAGAADASQA